MTQEEYDRQIEALNEFAAGISKATEAARQFLISAATMFSEQPKKKKQRPASTKKDRIIVIFISCPHN